MTNSLAGLFRARRKEAPAQALLARGLRLCGDHLAERGEGTGPGGARLVRAIGGYAGALASPSADPFDALLRVGERALEAGGPGAPELALAVADTAVEIRQRSKGAWRLRGLALDRLGREAEALESYDRCLELGAERARRGGPPGHHAAPPPRLPGEGRRAVPGGGGPAARPGSRTTAVTAAEFAAFVRARLSERGPQDDAVRRLLALHASYRRLLERSALPDPLLGGAEPVGVTGLRGLLAGRSVCLVSNAPAVADSTLGELIDGYDVVVRCDAFRIRAEGTGERTGLHAVTLRGDTPWEGPAWTRPAGIRLVFGDAAAAWRRALRQRLTAGAQEHVGDASLRRPLGDPALLGEDGWDARTTTAFTVLRLLDFLDVTPRLDLIGFDGGGTLRPREAAWVRDRATHVDDRTMRTALR
ncbi:tetratricopeptide repeat protein [Streptomyces sp. MMS20-AI2-20]|uniref:tetratricopeptide repeat protein n=1 Tax=Streptomyces sp. MMS20-AI2-20 TaxID=2925835 RepID=UPI001F61AAF9|nr:tetratricopeptide repeat protein [Streptomyces sp. MMS20-AI2-20]MCI4141703.1 tetratricopeptide repeat protein [Streptomyces sp. MMS20-AI2-20]